MKLALIQLNSGTDWLDNHATAISLSSQAAQRGAQIIALPEVCLQRGSLPGDTAAMPLIQPPFPQDATLKPWLDFARESQTSVLIGSVLEVNPESKKPFNTSLLIGPGGVVATYRKVHLFDIDAGDGATDKESDRFSAGDKAVVADTPMGKLGLTICYDLRFPELFRRLALDGAKLITVPANFTRVTGQSHWESLLRARAIENAVFIAAPAQCGKPAGAKDDAPGSFEAYGHSMIIDPWGNVLLEMDGEPGIGMVDIDLSEVEKVRAKIPSLQNRRPEVY